ncbi:hypothetical protein Plhal304r1_c078g0165041 [Plasmopara halstedii]
MINYTLLNAIDQVNGYCQLLMRDMDDPFTAARNLIGMLWSSYLCHGDCRLTSNVRSSVELAVQATSWL